MQVLFGGKNNYGIRLITVNYLIHLHIGVILLVPILEVCAFCNSKMPQEHAAA